jgi:hypothetical protein
MQDRNEFHLHHRVTPVRQHYAEANAPRKPLRIILALAVIVGCIGLAGGLTGCGGGAGADVPDAQPSSVPGAMAEVFGDSTMVRCYPGQIGDAVAYAENALGRKLINSAAGGSTSLSVTPQRIASSTAPAVVMNWAINDSHDVSPDAYRAQLTAQSLAGVAAGKAVVLVESTPIVPDGSLSDRRSDTDRIVFEAIKRDVAARTGAMYCAMPSRSWTLADKPDGIHENDSAAEWKGRVLADCIERAL